MVRWGMLNFSKQSRLPSTEEKQLITWFFCPKQKCRWTNNVVAGTKFSLPKVEGNVQEDVYEVDTKMGVHVSDSA